MSKPYRERAELFAQNPQGRIYGGFYPGGGFGTFGGGIDSGEDPQEAAAREFQEESGYPVTNVRPALVDPYIEDWKALSKKPEYANDPKFQERFKRFKGSRTHYFLGDIAGKRGLKDTGDSAYPFESVRFRAAPTVISKHEKDLQSVTDPVDVARLQQRLAVLQSMLEKKAMPFKSKAQQRFMFAAEDRGELPKGTAKEWADATEKKKGGIEALPEKVKPKTAEEMADTCLSKLGFWGRKKIKVWDPEERYEEWRKTDTPEQLLDTDLYNALFMANQGTGTGLLHRKGFKYPEQGEDFIVKDYKDRIASLKPEQKQFISEILWGAQPTPGKTASTRSIVMKKSAAEIAEEVCTPEEKAKCCKGEGDKKEEKKDEKKEEKKEEKSEGNPFAKKDETSEDKGFPFEKKEAASCGSSGKPMPKKKGFKPFPKKNIKKASDIADMILQKNAASSTDFIDKMRSKADKGLDATSRAAKSVVKKKDDVEGALRSKASKGVDAVNKSVNKASKKLKSVIEKKSSEKLAADVLKMSTPPLPRPIPQTPEVKQMKAQMSAPMPWEKSAATRWEQVFRESPEILADALKSPDRFANPSRNKALNEMDMFMDAKDFLKNRLGGVKLPADRVGEMFQARRAVPYGMNRYNTTRAQMKPRTDKPSVEELIGGIRRLGPDRSWGQVRNAARTSSPETLSGRERSLRDIIEGRLGTTPDLKNL